MWVIKDTDNATYHTDERHLWTYDLQRAQTYRTEEQAESARNKALKSIENAWDLGEDVGTNVPESKNSIEVQQVVLQEEPPANRLPRDYQREPEAGDIALCGENTLGVITSDEPQRVEYEDGSEAEAYVGLHLENRPDKGVSRGDRWSSRNPEIITTVDGLRDYALAMLITKDMVK